MGAVVGENTRDMLTMLPVLCPSWHFVSACVPRERAERWAIAAERAIRLGAKKQPPMRQPASRAASLDK